MLAAERKTLEFGEILDPLYSKVRTGFRAMEQNILFNSGQCKPEGTTQKYCTDDKNGGHLQCCIEDHSA